MTQTSAAGRALSVSIPVSDLERSKAFFAGLGFSEDPMFTDETAACLHIGEHALLMLVSRPRFAELSKRPVGDPSREALALFSFSVASRDEVDAIGSAALERGGVEADGAEDHGFMYSRSFFDLDGHGWQVIWMHPSVAESGPERTAAPARETAPRAERVP